MDKDYWNKIYANKAIENDNSPFAEFCLKNYFNAGGTVVDIAGGNGRDSIYFYNNNINVHLIDQSLNKKHIKEKLKQIPDNKYKFSLYRDNILDFDYNKIPIIDFFYLRWILHAINEEEEEMLLKKLSSKLLPEGLICIEARTTNDHLFGVGENLGDNSYFTDHFRRFIDLKKFLKKVKSYNLECIYSVESDGYSILKKDNPVLMRAILKKI